MDKKITDGGKIGSITDMTNTTHICLNGANKVDTMKLYYASYMQIVEFCNPE